MAEPRIRPRRAGIASGAAIAFVLLLAGLVTAGPAVAAPASIDGDRVRTASVVVQHPGNQISIIGDVISLQMSATGGTGVYTWSAARLPAGLTINPATGLISGRTVPIPGGATMVTITASGGGIGSVTFRWQVTRDVCPTC